MKKKRMIPALVGCCLLLIAASACNGKKTSLEAAGDPLGIAPVVAQRIATPEGDRVICRLDALKDTINLPLSYLTEDLQVIQLENKDEALVGDGVRMAVGDHYLLMSNNKQVPYKLFTREGKFVTDIGAYGQGPNEYINTYAEQLDESHNRIYILPWQSDKLLVFDLEGHPQPPIPLCLRVPKGQFRVCADRSEVTVTTLPFQGFPAVVWTQDLEGKCKSSVPTGALAVPQDFSNEVYMGNNTPDYDVMLMVIMPDARVDSLYHYHADKNRLEACFTVEYPEGKKIPWHQYYEYPRHFAGDVSFPVQVAEGMWSSTAPVFYLVDKETLRGSYFRLYNDFLGTSDMKSWPWFADGYYIANMEPAQLKEALEKELAKKGLPDAVRKRSKELAESLDEDGNNVVLLARMKK